MITRKSTYEDVAAEYLADFPTLAAKKKTFQAKFGTLVKRSRSARFPMTAQYEYVCPSSGNRYLYCYTAFKRSDWAEPYCNAVCLFEGKRGLHAAVSTNNRQAVIIFTPHFFERYRERILKQLLDQVKANYDYILLDCMPSLGMMTVNALTASNSALIPVQPNYLSAKGLEQLLGTINKVKRQLNPKLKIDGILLTMVDSRTNYTKEISSLIRDTYGGHIKVFQTEIPRSIRAAEISAEGKSIFSYDPKGKVADAYGKLTKEVMMNAEKRRKRQLEECR